MKKTETIVLACALDILADQIVSCGGVANEAIQAASTQLREFALERNHARPWYPYDEAPADAVDIVFALPNINDDLCDVSLTIRHEDNQLEMWETFSGRSYDPLPAILKRIEKAYAEHLRFSV